MEIAHIIELDRILKDRRTPIPLEDILDRLECSKSTFHRIQRDMIDFLGAPIKNIKNQGYIMIWLKMNTSNCQGYGLAHKKSLHYHSSNN